ncbi:MAG: C2 family cysteine protease [Phycisphaerae bacterium]
MLSATIAAIGSRWGHKASPSAVVEVGDSTSVRADDASSLTRAKLQRYWIGGYIAMRPTAGAAAEFTLDVATPGDYTLTLNTLQFSSGSLELSVNGNDQGSVTLRPSWRNHTAATLHLTLDAGTDVLRIQANTATAVDLYGFRLSYNAPLATEPALPTPVPSAILPPYTPPSMTATGTTDATGSDPAVIPGLSAMAVTINEHAQANFNELDVTGALPGETILVTQSGGTLTIKANGQLYHNTMALGELVIYAGSGNATITVDSSVTIPTRIYSGQGNDTIKNLTTGQATIVTLTGYSNTVTGNGINTAYWVSPSDTVNASSMERNALWVHTISGFYQPYTSTPGATGYVTNTRDGANLVDPAAGGNGWTRLTGSFWGMGPTQQDINQGQASDCYFLTDLQSLARLQPARLQQMAVDLGDGTYAVRFMRNGSPVYVRVDGDLPTASWGGLYYSHPGASGDQWVSIMEKAYAYLRTGANSYASLDYGYMTNVYADLGVSSYSMILGADGNSFYTSVNQSLSAKQPVDVLTHNSVVYGAPLVVSHCYAVIGVSKDAAGAVWVTLRNPWGVDGFNVDSNPNDGFVTVSYAALYANVTYYSVVNG